MTLHLKRSTVQHPTEEEAGGSSLFGVRAVEENEACFEKPVKCRNT
jgi:hypothetical protein